MAWLAPTQLLLLTLLPHAAFFEPNMFRKFQQKQTVPMDGQLDFKCEVMLSPNMVTGCTWLFQEWDPKVSPQFLAYNSRTKSSKIDNITVRIESDVFYFTRKYFQKEHQGYYFCMVIRNNWAHFSSRVQVLMSEPTTIRTTTPRTSPPKPAFTTTTDSPNERPPTCGPEAGRTSKEGWAVPAESCPRSPGAEVPNPERAPVVLGWWGKVARPAPKARSVVWSEVKKGLDVSCDTYIWAPLAGICTFLLLWLVTVLVCGHRRRRRVCKCPRPQVRLGGKPIPSERSV